MWSNSAILVCCLALTLMAASSASASTTANALAASRPFSIYGNSAGKYITCPSGVSELQTSTDKSQACLFAAVGLDGVERSVVGGEEFRIRSVADGRYVERVGASIYGYEPTHSSHRFRLGLVAAPTQTVIVSGGVSAGAPVPLNTAIGFSFGGTGTDPAKPDTSVRRMLTIQGGDGISVVVTWWSTDERLQWIGSETCAVDNGGCGPNAICQFSGSVRSCTCKPGFANTGLAPPNNCKDVDECSVGGGGCSANARCVNTEGSRTCQCVRGFAGDGFNCEKLVCVSEAALASVAEVHSIEDAAIEELKLTAELYIGPFKAYEQPMQP